MLFSALSKKVMCTNIGILRKFIETFGYYGRRRWILELIEYQLDDFVCVVHFRPDKQYENSMDVPQSRFIMIQTSGQALAKAIGNEFAPQTLSSWPKGY
jgi:hypothetical protein